MAELKQTPPDALQTKEAPAAKQMIEQVLEAAAGEPTDAQLKTLLSEMPQVTDAAKLQELEDLADGFIQVRESKAQNARTRNATETDPDEKDTRAEAIKSHERVIAALQLVIDTSAARRRELRLENATPASLTESMQARLEGVMAPEEAANFMAELALLVKKTVEVEVAGLQLTSGTEQTGSKSKGAEQEQAASLAEQIDYIRKNGDKTNKQETISDFTANMAMTTDWFRSGVRKWAIGRIGEVHANVKKGVEKRKRAENEKVVRTALEASGLGIMTQILEKNVGALGLVDAAKMAGDVPAEFNQLNANLMIMVDLGLIKEPAWFATAPKATAVARSMVATFNGVFDDGDQDKLRNFYKARVRTVVKAFPTLAMEGTDVEEVDLIVKTKQDATKPAEPAKAEKQEDKDAAEFLKLFGLSEAQLTKGLTAKMQDQFADGTEMELLVDQKLYTQEDVETTVLSAICEVKTNGKKAVDAKRLLQTLFTEGKKQ